MTFHSLIAAFAALALAPSSPGAEASPEAAIVGAYKTICLDALTPEASRAAVEALGGEREPLAPGSIIRTRLSYTLKLEGKRTLVSISEGACDVSPYDVDEDALEASFDAMTAKLENLEALPGGVGPAPNRTTLRRARWQPSGQDRGAFLELTSITFSGAEALLSLHRGFELGTAHPNKSADTGDTK